MQPENFETINSQNYEQAFQQALTLQQSKKYDEALDIYQKLLNAQTQKKLDLSREQVANISYNASLTAFNQKKFSLSYVYNQKALQLKPFHSEAQELGAKIQTEYQVRTLSRDYVLQDQLNKFGFKYLPIEIIWLVALIFGWFFINRLSQFSTQRKKDIVSGVRPQKFKKINWLWFAGFVFFGLLTYLKLDYAWQPRALIKTESAFLQTLPTIEPVKLVDLPMGTLVYLQKIKEVEVNSETANILFYQVKQPGGAAGWIKAEDLEIITN